MSKVNMNLQDSFLNQVRKESTDIKIVLLDGTELAGVVKGFDNFTVIIVSRGVQHLIYKHAIARIVGRKPAARRSESQSETKPKKDEGFNRLDLSQVKIEQASGQ
jgi:host factor-I protein